MLQKRRSVILYGRFCINKDGVRMKNKILFAVLLMFSCDASAGLFDAFKPSRPAVLPSAPEIEVKTDDGTVSFVQNRSIVPCAGTTSAGCTDSVIYMDPLTPEYAPDGTIKRLKLGFGFERLIVEISSDYPKGSCKYDLVMRHEMKHVAHARGVLRAYAPKLAEALKAGVAAAPLPVTQETYNSLVALSDKYFKAMMAKKTHLDDRLDAAGEKVYEWSECADVVYRDKKTGALRHKTFHRVR